MTNHYIIKIDGFREWVHSGPIKDLEKALRDVMIYTKGESSPGVWFYVLSTQRELVIGCQVG